VIPAIGAIGQAAASQLAPSSTAATGQLAHSQGEGLGQAEGLSQSASAGQGVSASQGISLGQSEPTLEGTAGAGPSGSFSGALTEAVSSLEKTQQSADSASQALATGTLSDPESAVLTVQNAQLEMQLASQIRTKAVEAAQSIFQTQV
jgi:flagellar hook-basal body complex protein FliE